MWCGNTNENYFFKKSSATLYLEPGVGGHGQSCAAPSGDSCSPSGTGGGAGGCWGAGVGCLALPKHFLSCAGSSSALEGGGLNLPPPAWSGSVRCLCFLAVNPKSIMLAPYRGGCVVPFGKCSPLCCTPSMCWEIGVRAWSWHRREIFVQTQGSTFLWQPYGAALKHGAKACRLLGSSALGTWELCMV